MQFSAHNYKQAMRPVVEPPQYTSSHLAPASGDSNNHIESG